MCYRISLVNRKEENHVPFSFYSHYIEFIKLIHFETEFIPLMQKVFQIISGKITAFVIKHANLDLH